MTNSLILTVSIIEKFSFTWIKLLSAEEKKHLLIVMLPQQQNYWHCRQKEKLTCLDFPGLWSEDDTFIKASRAQHLLTGFTTRRY